MLWSLIALRPLMLCMMCVASHVHVRGHTPRGWSRPVLVISHHLSLWCVGGLVTLHGRTASSWCGSHYSQQRLHPQRWAFDGQFTRCGRGRRIVSGSLSMNGGVKWMKWWSQVGVRGSELSDDIYRARSRQYYSLVRYVIFAISVAKIDFIGFLT